MTMRKKLNRLEVSLRALVLKLKFLLLLLPFLAPTQPVSAQSVAEFSTPYRWWAKYGSFYDYLDPVCTVYQYGYCILTKDPSDTLPAVAENYLATNLDSGIGPNGEGKVVFLSGNYGITTWIAYTQTYHNADECFDLYTGIVTGYCNTTDEKANYAEIVVNLYFYQGSNYNYTLYCERNLKHEVGHAIGMAHSTEYSLMRAAVDPDPAVFPWYLQWWEILWINANYY